MARIFCGHSNIAKLNQSDHLSTLSNSLLLLYGPWAEEEGKAIRSFLYSVIFDTLWNYKNN